MKLNNFKNNPAKSSFPENVQEFIDRRPEFIPLVAKAKRMLRKSLGRNYVGGTAIGKNYNTLILDITYQGSDVYINSDKNTITIGGSEIDNYKEFLIAVSEKYEICED